MAAGDSLFALDALSNRPPTSDFAAIRVRGEFVVLAFDDTTNEQAQFHAIVPSHYRGGPLTVNLCWTSATATSGVCKLRVELTRVTTGSNLDALPASAGSANATASAPATSGDLVETSLGAIAVPGLASGDMLVLDLIRLADDVADTVVGDVELVSVEMREA